MKIGDIEFDDVSSSNNFLTLRKCIDRNYDLSKLRRIIAFCGKNRQELKELHSFEVVIFTNDIQIQERITSESVGDVKVFRSDGESNLCPSLLENKNKSPFTLSVCKQIPLSETIKEGKEGSTLYVVMSPELTNTMIAIYSHTFKNLCLIYTPGDKRVENCIDKIKNGQIKMPREAGLQLIKTDITGFNLSRIEKFGSGNIIVNITPGPKSHAGILTVWGIQNKAKIYSINNSTRTIDSLDGSDRVEIKNPPLRLLLLLKDEIKNPGKELNYERKKFFYSIIHQFKELKDKYYKDKTPSDEEFDEKVMKILGDSNKKNRGHFFEDLAAFAFEKIGCSEILIGVKTKWSEESIEYIPKIYRQMAFKSEIDIICIFKKKYLVISTKTRKSDTKKELTSEIKAQSEILGRMSIPILVILRYHGSPEINNNGVTVIGWKTLFDEEELGDTLQKAIESRMTTIPRESCSQ